MPASSKVASGTHFGYSVPFYDLGALRPHLTVGHMEMSVRLAFLLP